MSNSPLVSVVTPVRNGAAFLEELITSVHRQDYPYIEHIIVNDGSTDGGATLAILQRYPHVRCWSQEHKGQFAAINAGLAAARGDVVNVINADDKYAGPSTVRSVVEFWRAHPECRGVYGRTLRMDGNGVALPCDHNSRGGPYPGWLLRYRAYIPHCSLFVATSLVIKENIWLDPSLKYCGDWDWIIRLSREGCFEYLDKPLALFRVHAAQRSQCAPWADKRQERRRVLRRHHANPVLSWILDGQHTVLAGLQILRTRGVKGLRLALRERRRRRTDRLHARD